MTTPSTAVPSAATPNIPPDEKEVREAAQKVVANDLKTWQGKFAKAADEGSDELEIRITEITDRMIQNQAQKVGRALNVQLEETVKSSLSSLKSSIISIVGSSEDEGKKEDALGTAVRKAGVAIKEKAQAVRTWRQSYDRETSDLISKAASDTFEIIDGIRDLGLQEIGMRWAWTDGITHKDWTKYHKLKGRFDEWRADVEKIATDHPGLQTARAASEEVESKAMETAEVAAKELARLKETGRWKISTCDSSDDWTTKIVPAVLADAGQKIFEKVSQASKAVAGTSQGTIESVSSAASSAAAQAVSSAQSIVSDVSGSATSIVSSLSSSVIDGTSQDSAESVISVASAGISGLVDQASSAVIGTQQGSVESIGSVAKSVASSIADQASSSAIGTSQGTAESIASVVSESASSLSERASSSIIGSEPGYAEKATSSIKSAASVLSSSASSLSDVASSSAASSEISKKASEAKASISSASSFVASSVSKSAAEKGSSINIAASSASSAASKKVWGGAMAQFVEAKQIIFEDVIEDPSDDDTYSEKIQSMASAAGDKFAEVTKAVSEALLKSKTTAGTVETITVLAADKYSSAISAASIALYGTEQGSGDSIASVVTNGYADAVSA